MAILGPRCDRTAKPTAARATIIPATTAPSVTFGDHEGSSAETGVAVGFAVIPVVTSAGIVGGACTIPDETPDGLAGVTPVIPVLISDAVALRPAWVPVCAVCAAPSPVLISDAVTC